jgi:prepilin-type N-terminal cleavage/methylation domain-containing protein
MTNNKKGFTLIELVVVMAIIAVLAALMVTAITAARKQSVNTQKVGNLKTIEVALETRASKCGGQYFCTSTNCATAITTTNISTVQADLVTQGFLTTAPIAATDAVAANYTVSVSSNTYTFTALDGASVLYTAQR